MAAGTVDPLRKSVQLHRKLTLTHALSYVVGTIIGSGIFISPKGIMVAVGSVGLTFIMWVACGLFAMLGALAFVELGMTIPKSGGLYTYVREMYGNTLGFIFLWTEAVMLRPAGNALSAFAFATYLLQPFYGDDCQPPLLNIQLVGAATVLLIASINMYSVKVGARFQVASTFGKLFALAMIIVIGVVRLFGGSTASFENPFENSIVEVGAFVSAFYVGGFAYAGYTSILYGVEELKNPRRNLPLCVILGVGIVILFYLLTNVAYLAVLTPDDMVTLDAVAVNFGIETLGLNFSWVMPMFVCISIAGTMNSSAFSYSRVFHTAAKNNDVPPLLSMINIDHMTPLPGLVTSLILTIISIFVGTGIYDFIATLGFVGTSQQAVAVIGLLWWRYKRRDMERPISFPWIIHVIYVLVVTFMTVITLRDRPARSAIGAGVMIAGLPVYYFSKRMPRYIKQRYDNFSIFVQKLLQVIPEEQDDVVSKSIPSDAKQNDKNINTSEQELKQRYPASEFSEITEGQTNRAFQT